MPTITAAGEYIADFFGRDSSARFLASGTRSASMLADFQWHTGGPPQTGDADDPKARGIVLFPVRAWSGAAVGIAAAAERLQSSGRPVILIASDSGKPTMPLGKWFIDNGATNGGRESSQLNGVANDLAAWTLFAEYVGAAMRRHWQPGILLSHLAANADERNTRLAFLGPMSAVAAETPPPVAGRLGSEYLSYVESLLASASTPAHQAMVGRAADSLRAWRASGSHLYVAACANYLQQEILTDTIASPFRPANGRWDAVQPLLSRGAKANDGVVWFGYAGYDCPHVVVMQGFADEHFRVVLVSDQIPVDLPANVRVPVRLDWHLPEHATHVSFNADGASSGSSIDATLHYLWLRRLVSAP